MSVVRNNLVDYDELESRIRGDGSTAWIVPECHQTEVEYRKVDGTLVDKKFLTFSKNEDEVWKELFNNQIKVVENRVIDEFIDVFKFFDKFSGIPPIEAMNEHFMEKTGWKIVPVHGLVTDGIFFRHLAQKQFPVTRFLRPTAGASYIQAPDLFHDLFGHVPMLADKRYTKFLELYGKLAMKAPFHMVGNKRLGALYWYTVEFGLIETDKGLRVYGAGIASSEGETRFALESDSPNRVYFDRDRLMDTDYFINCFQSTYHVLKSLDELDASLMDLEKNLYQVSDQFSDRDSFKYSPIDVAGYADDMIKHKGSLSYCAHRALDGHVFLGSS